MKLLLLTILFCGISWTPAHTITKKKVPVCSDRRTASFEMVPAGLFFQF